MAIFRRDNDSRRVAQFPNKETAQQTISLLAQSGALRAAPKSSRTERENTRQEIGEIKKDATVLANEDPKKYASRGSDGQPSIWNDNKPNFEATREAQVWPSKDSPSGKPGMANYKKMPPSDTNKPADPWA